MEPSPSSSSSGPAPATEQGKLFVGGISQEAREEALKDHFKRFGEVREVVVMKDRNTGHTRGFGFVQFADPEAAERALKEEKHVIRGRTVEVKRAIPKGEQHQIQQSPQHQYPDQSPYQNRGPGRNSSNNNSSSGNHSKSKKIFVGGLSDSIKEDEFRSYFEKFGTITDVVVMYDSLTHRPRGFGFITFDSEEAVENVMEKSFHELNGKFVEVKIAVPKDGNNHGNNSNYDHSKQNSRMTSGRGPVYGNYQAGFYPHYSPRYGYYHGYAPQPYSAYAYGGGYPMGAYGGIGYGGPFAAPRSPWNGQGLVATRRSVVPYGNAAMYHGYLNGGFGNIMGMASGGYHGVAAFGNGKGNQTSPDVQTTAAASTTPSQVESVKLDA